MPVFRINKNSNYTVMSNYHLRDRNLSFKAKGLLSFMLSLPENWDYSLNGLCSVSREGIRAIRTIIQELEANKYLEIKKFKGKKGLFEYEYLIYEYPYILNPDIRNGHVDTIYWMRTSTKQHTNKY